MAETHECDRCGATIIVDQHLRPETMEFWRYIDEREFESASAVLCGACLDDLWEFVFDAEIDRSDKADPHSLARVSENVERHIDELDELLTQIQEVNA